MSDDIEIYDNGFSPPTPSAAPSSTETVRRIAELIQIAGKAEIMADSIGRKIPADEYVGIMVWDLLTTGEAHYAQGDTLILEDFKDWQSLLKFVSAHLDGPVGKEGVNNINFFKVYQGFDPDRV